LGPDGDTTWNLKRLRATTRRFTAARRGCPESPFIFMRTDKVFNNGLGAAEPAARGLLRDHQLHLDFSRAPDHFHFPPLSAKRLVNLSITHKSVTTASWIIEVARSP